jgi:prepilin peptidase CpaA
MILLIIFLACLFVAIGAGVMASLSDMRGLTIPNSYSVAIISAFAVVYLALWAGSHEGMFHSFNNHLLGGLTVFGVTALLFAIGAIGAADSKLATAYAFWLALPGLLAFLFYTTVAGGVLGLLALTLKKWKFVKNPKAGSWIARVQAGENKVPYGVAIAAGALASFVKLGYFDMEALRSFLLS